MSNSIVLPKQGTRQQEPRDCLRSSRVTGPCITHRKQPYVLHLPRCILRVFRQTFCSICSKPDDWNAGFSGCQIGEAQ